MHRALLVESGHAHQARSAVDVRHPLGPGQPEAPGEERRAGGRVGRIDRVIGSQDPEAAVGSQDQSTGGVGVVGGGAEEHQVLVGQPAHERVERPERGEPVAHRGVVAHRQVDLVGGRHDLALDHLHEVVGTAVDLHLGPGFDRPVADRFDQPIGVTPHRQHRVHQEVDAEPVGVEHHPDRVDEERGVVGDHVQHRPGIGGARRTRDVHDPRDRQSPSATPRGAEVLDRSREQSLGVAVVDVRLGDLGVVPRQEVGQERVVGMALERRGHELSDHPRRAGIERCGIGFHGGLLGRGGL